MIVEDDVGKVFHDLRVSWLHEPVEVALGVGIELFVSSPSRERRRDLCLGGADELEEGLAAVAVGVAEEVVEGVVDGDALGWFG